MNMSADLLESKELAPEPEERNWKGICIAFFVIASIFSLIITAIIILNPDDIHNRVKLPRLTLDDVLNDSWKISSKDAFWISDSEVAYRDEDGNLVIFNCNDNSSYFLVSNTTFLREQVEEFEISADRKFMLFVQNKQKISDHSYLANYKLYNISNEQIINVELDESDNQLQFADWGPKGSQMIIAFHNDLYYFPQIGKNMDRLTQTGSDTIYNGITDWLYGSRIMKKQRAFWWSPEGNRIAFVTFNDSNVDTIIYPKYGSFSDPNNLFTELIKSKFPRAGQANPSVTLWTLDLFNDYSLHKVIPPYEINGRDHYLTALSWIDEDRLAAIWMRREQNYSVVSLCDSRENWSCNKHLEEKLKNEEPGSWIEMFDPPLITKDKRHYLITLPLNEPENGAFRQIVMITINGKVKNYLTKGQQDVTKILAYHQETRTVFYTATLDNGPGERHIFSIPDIHSSLPRIPYCITCNETGRNCSFNDAIFNPTARFFILKCLGATIPWTEVRSVDAQTVLFKTGINKKLKTLLQQKAFPQQKSFRVAISSEHSAEVRLILPPALREYEEIKYPLIVQVDSEPDELDFGRKFSLDFGLYLASNRSFIYAKIHVRKSKINRFTHDYYHKIGNMQADDYIRVVNYMKRHLHFIDSTRICIWGWSFGGYIAASALIQSDLFNCCVAVAPITDWLFVDSFTAERYFGNPWNGNNFVHYERADLSSKAHHFKNKNLFILHGTADDAVHLQHSFTFMKALNKKDVFYRTQLYPDSSHLLEDVRYHLYTSIEMYFVECLLSGHDVIPKI